MDFASFFQQATGVGPYSYQKRLAADGLPDVLEAPMGAGKTAGIVLAWLWRRLHSDSPTRSRVPRRLIFALPMRTLVDQVETNVSVWLQNLDLTETVLVNVVMGGRRSDEGSWRMHAHRPSITIGTVDSLVSKALMRGYGTSRGTYPIDFALVTNGAHVVIDEVQLAPAATATLRQLSAFQQSYGTAEPFGLTCVSATVDRRVLDTVDNPAADVRAVGLTTADRSAHLGSLLEATKTVRRLPVDADDYKAIAQQAAARHRSGTRTLVVVNTVKAATGVARALERAKPSADVLLVHSRFRGRERARLADRLTDPVSGAGLIAVATQVVEAGVDIDSSVMITEVSPWASLCQRSGRCNRYAAVEDAELWWYSAGKSTPYDALDLEETERVLLSLEGEPCSGERLLAERVAPSELALRIIRRPDFLALFDTTPDLSGTDIDISPYIRSGAELDCHLAWISTDVRGPLESTFRPPDQDWRCPAPISEVRQWLRGGVRAWTFSSATQRWDRVDRQTRVRPGELVLVHADEGGYDPVYGFAPGHTESVDIEQQIVRDTGEASDAMSDDSTNTGHRDWLTLDVHLKETAAQAAALRRSCEPDLPQSAYDTLTAAALLHDVGKLHPAWQSALRSTQAPTPPPGGPLAKSPGHGRLNFDDHPGLRHELVSALLVSSPAGAQLCAKAGATTAESALLRYLVAAHHGKIRVQIPPVSEGADQVLGVRNGEDLPEVMVLDVAVPPWTTDLKALAPGAEGSWTRAALGLLDRFGPFRLAYMEMLVRMADWRASAGLSLAGEDDLR